MLDSLSIRLKIMLLSGLCLLGVIGLIVSINIYQSNRNNQLISTSSSKMLTDSGETLIKVRAAEQAANLQRTFSDNLLLLTTLSEQMIHLRNVTAQRGLSAVALREELNQSLRTSFDHHPEVLGMWMLFEPNVLAGKDSDFVNDTARASNETGRFASAWNRGAGQTLNILIPEADLRKTELSISGTPYNSWYTCPKDTRHSCLMAPYADNQAGQVQLMTTLSIPLVDDGKVIGVMGLDLALGSLQAAASDAQRTLFNGSGSMFIVSGGGVLAAYSKDSSQIAKSVGVTLGEEGKEIIAAIARKEPVILAQDNVIRAIHPVAPIADAAPWGIVIDLPKQVLLADSTKLQALLDHALTRDTLVSLSVAIGAGLVGLLLVWLTASGVTRPINSVAQMLKAIASGDGDLTQRLRYNKKDELGALADGFNLFLDKLQPTVAQIKQSITDTRSTADKSSEISRQTSEGMHVQFREIDQLATASNELSATAHEVAHSASSAAQAARGADQASKAGITLIERSTRDINALSDEVSKAVNEVEALASNSEQIGTVLEVIRSIAEQTNLLALNAAIEAARAGDNGRGFAVVADEVRSLAKRTQSSVEEIRQVIERIQSSTQHVVSTMHSSHTLARENVGQIQQAAYALGEISDAVTVISDMNLQIASAAEEQSAVAEELNRNVATIRGVTETLTEQAAESAKISGQLNAGANQQMKLMDQFRV
ncbi:methyl-accepting chemotaxis protein [Pseudomonas oryzihabitans]|uniref:methyl-accepting chemotaxis protein n=1 Tax=Pseudomonas oryzihabitans TaxID=47885 RepID=UPI002557A6C5|nr:methyl-accepting chemotaxis protein [Pseudomonas oryzihabitans]MDK8264945.1 methyl-accepting chemotaxis protein [Pseudomonas oryzihabitans]